MKALFVVISTAMAHLEDEESVRERMALLLAQEEEIRQSQTWQSWLQLYFDRYGIELLVLLVLIVSLINFLIGWNTNVKKANRWLAVCKPFLL